MKSEAVFILLFFCLIMIILIVKIVSRESIDKVEYVVDDLTEMNDYIAKDTTFQEDDLVLDELVQEIVVDTRDYPTPESPWVAIIIDDFGPPWKRSVTDGFLNSPYDITISIIPGNLQSKSIAERAIIADKEVFIHLPMEPEEEVAMSERDMLFVYYDSLEVEVIIRRVLEEIPNAVGCNNHMGSKATRDEELMRCLAYSLKNNNLVFVDSRTVHQSVALPIMKEYQIPSVGRDVFLDTELDTSHISTQLSTLIDIAKRRGWSVGIGHTKEQTLSVLIKELPRYEEDNIRFVSVGKLINTLNNKTVVSHTLLFGE